MLYAEKTPLGGAKMWWPVQIFIEDQKGISGRCVSALEVRSAYDPESICGCE